MGLVNYHTHTTRCQHAVGTDREYVERAFSEGFSTLGFSDHTPWPYEKEGFVSHIRMREDELAGYVSSLQTLREEYLGRMDVKIGLECEAFPQYFSWLRNEVRKYGIDYLILGNHFRNDEMHGLYFGHAVKADALSAYVRQMEAAVATGMFFYIAHPDFVFSRYPLFDADCEQASRDMCDLASSNDIPLEYNLSGIWKRQEGEISGLGYPCRPFWEIAHEYNLKVIVGLDAHDPRRISRAFFCAEMDNLRNEGFNVIN